MHSAAAIALVWAFALVAFVLLMWLRPERRTLTDAELAAERRAIRARRVAQRSQAGAR